MEIKITTDNFKENVLESDLPVLIDFYADWCGPCKMMGPVIDELADELNTEAKIGKINVDTNPSIAQKYRVMSIPTIIVLKDGNIVERFEGVTSKTKLESVINNLK